MFLSFQKLKVTKGKSQTNIESDTNRTKKKGHGEAGSPRRKMLRYIGRCFTGAVQLVCLIEE